MLLGSCEKSIVDDDFLKQSFFRTAFNGHRTARVKHYKLICMFLFTLCCLLESYPLDIIIILCVHLIVDLFLQSFSFLIFCLLEFQLQSYTLSDINNLTFFLRKLLKIVEKNENPLLFIFHCCVIDDDFNFLLSLGYRNKINNWSLCFNCTQNEKLLQFKN